MAIGVEGLISKYEFLAMDRSIQITATLPYKSLPQGGGGRGGGGGGGPHRNHCQPPIQITARRKISSPASLPGGVEEMAHQAITATRPYNSLPITATLPHKSLPITTHCCSYIPCTHTGGDRHGGGGEDHGDGRWHLPEEDARRGEQPH